MTGVRSFSVGLVTLALAASSAHAAAPRSLCGLYSTVLLNADETAEGSGAGRDSVSLLIKGKSGTWIFYDGLVAPSDRAFGEIPVFADGNVKAFRRRHDARIYVLLPTASKSIDGKFVQVGVMGVDFMRQPLANPAITGAKSDIAVLKRVLPGRIDRCNLRWVPGTGIVGLDD